jgi:hypothetical protein
MGTIQTKTKRKDIGECPICLGSMYSGTYLYSTVCAHTFHHKCIQTWFEWYQLKYHDVKGQFCPVCWTKNEEVKDPDS